MAEFGIYVLTYPGDFHLAKTLIRSLRYFHPDIPIVIIPGEGFDRSNHPFYVEVLPEPRGFWKELGYHSRDFWAYQGPFEKFLYLDADVICTGSLAPLIGRIRAQEGDFVFGHICFADQQTWEATIGDDNHPMHGEAKAWVRRGLGDPVLLRQFDTAYNPYGRAPFCAGLFASRRGAITEDILKALHEKEVLFYDSVVKKKFHWRSGELFNSDQGRLNYLVDTLNLRLVDTAPDGHDFWAGDIREKVTVEAFLNKKLEYKFIHWAGVPRPRPSLFCQPGFRWLDRLTYNFDSYRKYEGFPEIPGQAVWRYFQVKNEYPMRMRDRLSYTYSDFRRFAKMLKSKGKGLLGRSA